MTPMIQDPPIQDPSGGRRARRRRLQRWIVICGLLVAVLGLASTFWLRADAPPDETVAQPSPPTAAAATGSADLASAIPPPEAPPAKAPAAAPASPAAPLAQLAGAPPPPAPAPPDRSEERPGGTKG